MHPFTFFCVILLSIFVFCLSIALLVFAVDCIVGLIYEKKERKKWKR